jgi:hypothetical protein
MKIRLLATLVLISTLILGLGATAQASHCGTPLCFGDTVSGTGPVGLQADNASTTTGHAGLVGRMTAPSGTTYGIWGKAASSNGTGVFGQATAPSGNTIGVVGHSSSTSGRGVLGVALAPSGQTKGVSGETYSPLGIGVYGLAASGASDNGRTIGVYGVANTDGLGTEYGVLGESAASDGRAVFGYASATSGSNIGVSGQSRSLTGVGVLAKGSGVTGTALKIETGAIKVAGASLGSGTPVFIHRAISGANIVGHYTRIDHPLTNGDPNAILIVTPNWNPGGVGGVANNHSIGVFYKDGRWAIFNQDSAAMPDKAAFNVLIVKR